MSSSQSNFASATEMFKQVFEQVEKDKQQVEEEKKMWEQEKAKIRTTFKFDDSEQRIMLDVGGTRYSTSRSTLTKYPESMLGVMFSGRHDLETMKCSDGSFFIDRDGTHFRHILNYLRDGEEVIITFPHSPETVRELLREAKYYQLEGLVTALNLLWDCDVISQNDISDMFTSYSTSYDTDYSLGSFSVSYKSTQAIAYKTKNMKGLSFNSMMFSHPVSFIDCDLTNTAFTYCYFGSDVIFKYCILDGTRFSYTYGLVTNSHNVSFTGSVTNKTSFDVNLRKALQSAGKIK